MAARKKPVGSQEERDRIALGMIESYMDAVTTGELACPCCKKTTKYRELTPAAAILLRARYDKLRPTLSTVEQTIHDERDNLNEEQVLGYLQGLFTAKPDLLDRLIQLRDAARLVQEGTQVVVEIQHKSEVSTT